MAGGIVGRLMNTIVADPAVVAAVFLIVLNPCLWNAIGRFEHKTRRVSGTLGQRTGVYLTACLIFVLGIVRDVLFELAIRRSPHSRVMAASTLLLALGYAMGVGGAVLVFGSLYRLGLTGTYLGDYFGILLPSRVTAFPFSHFEHPMYQGATMLFLGRALVKASPVGIALASLSGIVYSAAGSIEGPFTAAIYSARQSGGGPVGGKRDARTVLNGRRPTAGKRD